MRLLDPWFLALFALLPLLLLWGRRRRPLAVHYSSNHAARGLAVSLRTRLASLPTVLRLLALACIIVALARPVAGEEHARNLGRGIAIEMAIDRSGSMRSPMEFDGRRESRLAVVKQVFRSFVNGNDRGLAGRPNDLIGLVTFARYADTICPLTLDHRTLDAFLGQIHLPLVPALDGTSIGDGIALAAAHLKELGKELVGTNGVPYHVASKIIILLTDGQNNFGRLSPLAAARLAKEWGIRIYTIGIGSTVRPETINTIFGPQTIAPQSGVDTTILREIAATTGGIFQLASNGSALEAVYRKIDRLEKSMLPARSYLTWRELFLPFVLGAFTLLLGALLLENTLLRRIP